MSQPHAHHDNHHVPPFSTPSHPRLTTQLSHPKPSRPRLSLNTTLNNTTNLRSFGKGSSLRLDTLSAVSPTARNTFSNALVSKPASTTIELRPKLFIDPSVQKLDLSQDPASSSSSRTPSSSSVTSSTSTTESFYDLPKGTVSILVNSPITKAMTEPRPASQPKRVAFRDTLCEEITTTRYTMRHSDISVSQEELPQSNSLGDDTTPTAPKAPSLSTTQPDSTTPPTIHLSPPPRHSPRKIPRPRCKLDAYLASSPLGKRDSSDSDDSDDSYAQTPVAGRCKRQRNWHWTLDPLPGHKKEGEQNSSTASSIDGESASSRATSDS